MSDCCTDAFKDLSRRGFVKLALGAGAALWVNFKPSISLAAGGTEALLLSCMDYRLMDDIVRYMDGRAMTNKYDHVVLAGASLGVLQDKNLSWGQTFWDHVQVALDLHHIQKVIVMDHRDCGAYKVFLGPDSAKDAATETASHTAKLRALRTAINAKHPTLAVELLLMDLEGKVETVA
ncbi:carbonic anhydrase [Paramagnetospirillum magneticum]|nr:carbonic anhydrase [Paramagnetospirillum magneticum]